MKWNSFSIGFLLVILCSFAKAQVTDYWVPIEFSFFLIFFIIRSSSVVRALTLTLILSLGLDLILQAGQIKGLAAMGQLVLIYVIAILRRHVNPLYEDLFLLGFFAIFYVTHYYINVVLSRIFGVHYQGVPFTTLIFLSLFHTALFSLMLFINVRFRRGTS